ncbi:MAG: hypothetical protein KME08_06200 [Aphanothece sp. CMT-3BRIN-NPC111]|jgi:hypothetical protein|nr:hypothetical protein [Aphanothece sp. CMT-3BRIN-NPC111]
MESWEFLLQKEGDRSWLPLKTPRVEIQEARYRVVVHTNRANTDVEISVTHQAIGEDPPRRRSQKRSHRTNREGLMVVIPFTYLKPGIWELRCSSDIMSVLMGDTWEQEIQLQVLPNITETLPQPASPVETTQAETIAHSQDAIAFPPQVETVAQSQDAIAFPAQPETVAQSQDAIAPHTHPETVAQSQDAIAFPAQPETVAQSQDAIAFPAQPETVAQSHNAIAPHTQVETVAQSQDAIAVPTHPETATVPHTESSVAGETPDEPAIAALAASEALEPTFADVADTLEPTEFLGHQEEPHTDDPDDITADLNPMLEECLLDLEQLLQQVLDPLWEDVEASESTEDIENTIDSVQPQEQSEDVDEVDIIPFVSSIEPTDNSPQGLTLTLHQETLVARRGDSVRFSGQVNLLDIAQPNSSETPSSLTSIFRGSLEITLRNPQNSQVLLKIRRPLPQQVPPLTFSCTLQVPPNCQTRLILGEVTIYDATPAALVSEAFSITVDLEELLNAIFAQKAEGNTETFWEDLLNPSPEPAPAEDEKTVHLNLAFLDLVEAPPDIKPLQPSPSSPLPSKIYQPPGTRKASKSPQLPKLPKPQPAASAEAIPAPLESINEPRGSTNKELTHPTLPFLHPIAVQQGLRPTEDVSPETPEHQPGETKLEASSPETLQEPEPLEHVGSLEPDNLPAADSLLSSQEAAEVPINSELVMQQPEASVAETSGIDNSFQSLKLQDRFWSRLNALAADAELPELPNTESSPIGSPDDTWDFLELLEIDTDSPEAEPLPEPLALKLEANQIEVAVQEETDASPNSSAPESAAHEAAAISPTTSLEPEMPLDLRLSDDRASVDWTALEFVVDDELTAPEPAFPSRLLEDKPLPPPELVVPTGELTAGQPVAIRVKLPPDSAHIYVKLWVQDRQSRSLLDGPRWLVDFSSNGSGTLEAMTQLTVPFGSLEIRLEAIAIDTTTQRESHKVTVDRVVVPPNVPSLWRDEFQA